MKSYFFKGIKFVFLFLFISKFQLAYPFDEVKSIDIRALSLGQVRALSSLVNPAFLSFSEQKQIGASVFNRFEMKELSTQSIFGLIPNRLLDMNCRLSVFGYSDYQLIEGQAGFAKKLSSKFSIGTTVSYLIENSILEESARTYLQADVSFLWQISKTFEWALITENLLHTRNSQPVSCFSGLKCQLIPGTCVLAESGYDTQKRFSISAGVEYEIVKQLTVRGGFRNNPQTPSLGFAYKLEQWNVETAFLFHQALGLSSGIAVAYLF
jgi:hypothetical protein